MTGTDPQRYLAAADDMLRGAGVLGAVAVTDGWWPKACACLIRLALEGGIDAFWLRASSPVARCGSRRTKLLMLRKRIDLDVVHRVSFAWAALSRLTHHHCYDASPTLGELRHLYDEAKAALEHL
ncbi:MAG TPA: hypothetical protein VFB74_16395 [Kribbellaceae bacterium]|nr:hypothetical protein [Kribbellaceae bacterium]